MSTILRDESKRIACIFVCAFLLRLIYLSYLVESPFFDSPKMDSNFHADWAMSLAAGGPGWEGPYFRAPLYPYFLSLFYMIAGEQSAAYLLVRVAQFFIGSMSCVLLYLIGRRLYGISVGTLAGSMAAFYWLSIYFEGELLLPVLIVFLNLLGFLLLIESIHSRRWQYFLMTGIAFGLSSITRPNILIFFPFLLLWVFLRLRKLDAPRPHWAPILIGLGIIVCILPVTLRNGIVGNDWVLIASQAGVNFYIGNNPESNGVSAVVPGTSATWWGGFRDTKRIAEEKMGRSLKPSEVSAYWFRKGFQFIAHNPLQATKQYWHKARVLLAPKEISNNQSIPFYRQYLEFLDRPIFLSFWMVAPLGLAGILIARKDEAWFLLAGFIAIYSLSFLPFFITARYRLPVIPFLLIFASLFLTELVSIFRQRRWQRLCYRGVVLAGVMILFWINATSEDLDSEFSDSWLAIGHEWKERGDTRQALTSYDRAIRLNSEDAEAYYSRGIVYLDLKRYDEALADHDQAIQLDPRHARAHINRGSLHLHLKQHEEALADYNRAIQLNPNHPGVYNSRGNLYLVHLGRSETGCSDLRKACMLGACRHYQAAVKRRACRQ